jgi:hypothetical protein
MLSLTVMEINRGTAGQSYTLAELGLTFIYKPNKNLAARIPPASHTSSIRYDSSSARGQRPYSRTYTKISVITAILRYAGVEDVAITTSNPIVIVIESTAN